MAPPLSAFDRWVAKLLNYDTDAQDARIAKTEAVRRFSIRSRLAAEQFIADYERAERRRRHED